MGDCDKSSSGQAFRAADLTPEFSSHIETEGFEVLSISVDHAVRAGLLPGTHKDPFDRMLIAQAQAENLVLVSNEEIIRCIRRAPNLVNAEK